MFKSTVISTVFAVSALQASAGSSSKFDLSILPPDVAARVIYLEQFGDRYETAIEATLAEWRKPSHSGGARELDLSNLSPEVAGRVVRLQDYGDRFHPAIRAIIYESLKPSSGFCDSGHVEVTDVPADPQS